MLRLQTLGGRGNDRSQLPRHAADRHAVAMVIIIRPASARPGRSCAAEAQVELGARGSSPAYCCTRSAARCRTDSIPGKISHPMLRLQTLGGGVVTAMNAMNANGACNVYTCTYKPIYERLMAASGCP